MTNEHPTNGHPNRHAAAGARIAGSALLAAALSLAIGCASPPDLADGTTVADRTLHAESPVEWQSRTRACRDAGKRARAAVARTCEATHVSVPRAACACRPSAVTPGAWRCTASATYACAGDALVAGGPR